jgi:uncharacterized membrane protein YfcA
LPLKMRFVRSRVYASALPPLMLGVLIGVLSVIIGVGGGVILVPALIYLLRLPTAVAVGTSLFQTIFVAAFSTLLHAITNQSVDALLALMLITGAVCGVQLGVRIGGSLRGDLTRFLFAALVLGICVRLGLDLVVAPSDAFAVVVDRVEE